ncbi:amidohydrolase family protein [Actinophytocola sp. KF-1]
MIVDAHARLGPTAAARDRLLSMMDGAGIDRAVVVAGGVIDLDTLARQLVSGDGITADAHNEFALESSVWTQGRLIPFFFANPHRDPAVYLAQAADYRGVEISPAVHGVPLDDPRTVGLVEVAASAGHPVYTVCLYRQGCGVSDLVALARKFPSTTFILGHLGVDLIDTYAVDLVSEVDNVLVETSGGYTVLLRVAYERLGPSRLLFGSEAPHQHPSVELAKFAALDLPETDQILGGNVLRLLGEDR